MLLLTIGIIVLGLAGVSTSYFWLKVLERQEESNQKLLEFIDKNIKERVVYTNKIEGYSNEDRIGVVAVEEDDPVDAEEIQELDVSQLDKAVKHKPIKN